MTDGNPKRTPDSGHAPESVEFLTAREAAERAGVHERTVRRAILRGDLPAEKASGEFRIAPSDLYLISDHRGTRERESRSERGARKPGQDSSLRPALTSLIGREREVASIA